VSEARLRAPWASALPLANIDGTVGRSQ